MKFHSKDISLAKKLDADDPLKNFRDEFVITEEKIIYLNGNSLGRLPLKTQSNLNQVINQQWGERLVRNWNEGWFDLPSKVGAKIAKIIGAQEDEVIIADSTSINLYKLVLAALQFQSERKKIVSDEFNFPSDLYVIQGIIKQLQKDHSIAIVKSKDGITIDSEDINMAINSDTALLTLSHTCFKSAFLYDMENITKLAHDSGALMLWDLSHSVGVVDIDLNKSNVDMAIGCTYKYLNGGPGAPAFIYVRKDLQDKLTPSITGWFGDSNPFEFNLEYSASEGIKKFLTGTPPIVSLSAVDSSIDLILDAGIDNIRIKSIKLTEYLVFLINKILLPLEFKIGSPLNENFRGSHISIKHPEAFKIVKAMTDEKNKIVVIPDFREPDNIRLGLSPLYTSFEEVWLAVNRIEEIVLTKEYQKYQEIKSVVT